MQAPSEGLLAKENDSSKIKVKLKLAETASEPHVNESDFSFETFLILLKNT